MSKSDDEDKEENFFGNKNNNIMPLEEQEVNNKVHKSNHQNIFLTFQLFEFLDDWRENEFIEFFILLLFFINFYKRRNKVLR